MLVTADNMSTSPVAAHYVKTTFDTLPGWADDDHTAAFATFLVSSRLMAGQPEPADLMAKALRAACVKALAVAANMTDATVCRHFFEQTFEPHSVSHAPPEGLLTGYYEPLVKGSRERSERYSIPVYRRPPDLVNIVAESERGAKQVPFTHMRQTVHGLVPFATRQDIEQGVLEGLGLELLYLDDPVEAFFMHIQGSGRVALPDGEMIRISYDGKNGYPYTSIGGVLIQRGEAGAATMSLDRLALWLRADAERGRQLMWQNRSYIFFRELTGAEAEGAMGVDGIALTPGRSLAVDTGYHVVGTPIYVVSPTITYAGQGDGFKRLMIAQDVGSAIKGPERGDIFFGCGQEAGRLAGITKEAGKFYALLPKMDGRP